MERARPAGSALRDSAHTVLSKWQKPGAGGGGEGSGRGQREAPAVWNRALPDYAGVGTGRDPAPPSAGRLQGAEERDRAALLRVTAGDSTTISK